MFRRIGQFLPVLFLLVLSAVSSQAQQVYVESSNSQLGLLNPLNGAYTLIGTTSERIAGMGFASDGNLYGLGDDMNIYRINPGTAALTLVGSTGLGQTADYTFGAARDGTLYETHATQLYAISPTNGMASLVGSPGFNNSGGVTGDNNNNLYALQGPSGPGFYQLNRTTGAGTLLGNPSVGVAEGLAFTQGSMYAMNTQGSIYSLNLSNGSATFVSTYDTSVVGSVYSAGSVFGARVPAPSALLTTLMGGLPGACLLLRRRRK